MRFRYLALPLELPSVPESLSAAERDILDRVVGGESNHEISRARGTSSRTVANQLRALYVRLGVSSRHELIRAVIEQRGDPYPQ